MVTPIATNVKWQHGGFAQFSGQMRVMPIMPRAKARECGETWTTTTH